MSQLKSLLAELQIGTPEEVTTGVFKTALTHPLLEGELYFVHGRNSAQITLDAVNTGLVKEVKNLVALAGELANESKKVLRSQAAEPTTGNNGEDH